MSVFHFFHQSSSEPDFVNAYVILLTSVWVVWDTENDRHSSLHGIHSRDDVQYARDEERCPDHSSRVDPIGECILVSSGREQPNMTSAQPLLAFSSSLWIV